MTIAGVYGYASPPENVRRTTAGVVERLTPAGATDPRFKTNSLAMECHALQPIPGGDVVAVGESLEGPPESGRPARAPALIQMLTADGARDRSFGHAGVVELTSPSGEASAMSATAVLRESNGDLVISGRGSYTTGASFVTREQSFFSWIARLTPSGRLDQSFGQGGMIFSAPPSGWQGGILEPRAGGLAIVGATGESNHEQITVWGLTSRGALDPSFGSAGMLMVPNPPGTLSRYPTAATVDHAGRLLIAGSAGLQTRPEIVRITPNGQVDHGFGEEGIVQGPPQSRFRALAVEPSGRVLAAGELEPETPDPSDGGWLEQHGLQQEDALIERFLATNSSHAGAPEQATVKLLTPHVRARGGRLHIKLACAGADACHIKLTLRITRPRSRSITGTFRIPAGHTVAVTLRLDDHARKLLHAHHHHHLAATLTILKLAPAPRVTQTENVTIA